MKLACSYYTGRISIISELFYISWTDGGFYSPLADERFLKFGLTMRLKSSDGSRAFTGPSPSCMGGIC